MCPSHLSAKTWRREAIGSLGSTHTSSFGLHVCSSLVLKAEAQEEGSRGGSVSEFSDAPWSAGSVGRTHEVQPSLRFIVSTAGGWLDRAPRRQSEEKEHQRRQNDPLEELKKFPHPPLLLVSEEVLEALVDHPAAHVLLDHDRRGVPLLGVPEWIAEDQSAQSSVARTSALRERKLPDPVAAYFRGRPALA